MSKMSGTDISLTGRLNCYDIATRSITVGSISIGTNSIKGGNNNTYIQVYSPSTSITYKATLSENNRIITIILDQNALYSVTLYFQYKAIGANWSSSYSITIGAGLHLDQYK